jgi:spermidine/putrescine transport system ATP-binding protein
MGLRKPSQLSGGQQQRVALARALVNRPAVLLLDEPLGALDLKLRKAMQIELKQLQAQVGITFVYVTHDQEEALTMSNRIAVMNQGEILQVGDPITLYEKPATRFVADFIGESNFLEGRIDSLEDGKVRLIVDGGSVMASLTDPDLVPSQTVMFTIRPEKIQLANPEEILADSLQGVIEEVVYIGTDTRYIISLKSNQNIVVRVQNGLGSILGQFRKGDRVKLHWMTEDARVLVG